MPTTDHTHATNTDEAIELLVVDEDERWARYTGRRLEQHDPTLQVTVAVSPNEALQQLRAETGIDCLLTSAEMQGVDGLQLLDQAREIQPGLPVLLTVSGRDESLVAEGLAAGVVDICPKEPDADRTAQFANRIRAAVRERRLQRSVEETAQRYRTVTQQSSDAVAIVQNETFVFWNGRLSDLTGYDNSEINTFYPAIELFHPADRSFVRGKLAEWDDGKRDRQSHEARLLTEQGATRYCELRGQGITYESDPAVLLSATDTTAKKRRKRELEWEKQLNRTVQRALIDADTREEITETICDQLCRYGYELAWTGGIRNEAVTPQVVRGEDTSGIAEGTFPIEETHDAPPNVWAARLKEPQFLNDLTTLFETPWQQRALEAGYRSGAALPLGYEGMVYGVLVVYSDLPDQFDETERTLLKSLANVLGFAIHNIETKDALSAQRTVEIELQLRDTSYYLNELVQSSACRAADAQFTVTGTVPHSEAATIQYVTLDGIEAETFGKLARDHPTVTDVSVITTDPARVQVVVTDETPEQRLATLGAVINTTTVRLDGATLHIELPAVQNATETIGQLEESFDGVTLESVVESDQMASVLDSHTPQERTGFTDKQATALRVAFHDGYFEHPRKNTASEIADTLDISHSTFLQHLRVAQQKLLAEMYNQQH